VAPSTSGSQSHGPEHSIAGAVHAIERLGDGNGRILAYCIAGHHAGLTDWASSDAGLGSLDQRLARARTLDLLGCAKSGDPPASLLRAPTPTDGPRDLDSAACAFFTRMIFSALVDADFLDTEVYFDRARTDARSGWPPLRALLPVLDAYVDAMSAHCRRERPGPVNEARAEVLAACRERAMLAPGLFTLTVPTGGGKTLSSLAFALRHARAHNLRRVVYAIPYTSIIEQTADIFREVFAPLGEVLVEHHSSLAPNRETNRSRLASENWDAPLIVTTTVQLFESLFASKTSRCRKLHNLANSVLILDEAQLLPSHFLRPILFALDELMGRYGVSVVLSTATQPALMQRPGFPGLRAPPRELAPDPERHRRALRRIRIERLHGLNEAVTWPELAGLLVAEPRALCVVDRRAAARDLHALMPPGTFHLSALMCPAHRSSVLADIRAALQSDGVLVRVVATQLVEAGVDLDFPVVFRAVAGLDSIAQAAGRCNREGRLSEPGRVVVFRAPHEPPPGILRQAAQISLPALRTADEDPLTLDAFSRFFADLYWSQGSNLDREHIVSGSAPLLGHGLDFRFRTAAEKFRIIEADQMPVVVPYGDGMPRAREVERYGLSRERLRGLQRFIVGVFRHSAPALLADGAIREIAPGLFLLDNRRLYTDVGLDLRRSAVYAPEDLML